WYSPNLVFENISSDARRRPRRLFDHGNVSDLRQKAGFWQQCELLQAAYPPDVEAQHSEDDAHTRWRRFRAGKALRQVPADREQVELVTFELPVEGQRPIWTAGFFISQPIALVSAPTIRRTTL